MIFSSYPSDKFTEGKPNRHTDIHCKHIRHEAPFQTC